MEGEADGALGTSLISALTEVVVAKINYNFWGLFSVMLEWWECVYGITLVWLFLPTVLFLAARP